MTKASAFIAALARHVGDGYVYGATGVSCTISLLKAKEKQYGSKMGNGYYQLNGDYNKGKCARWMDRWVADCSNMLQAIRRELGEKVGSASAHMQYQSCGKNVWPIAQMRRQPGALVFKNYGTTAKPRMGHAGMYVGDDTVIEDAGVTKGVIRSKLSAGNWTDCGLPSWLELDTEKPPIDNKPDPEDLPYLRQGSKGSYVRMMQELLIEKGYGRDFIPSGMGEFGPRTDKAVRAFQRAEGIEVDGIVGPITWGRLLQ